MKRRAVFPKKYRKSKRGMTLVEIVVAIAIVAIVFAGTMSALVSAYTSILYNSTDAQASHEAEGITDKVMESIKGKATDADILAIISTIETENDATFVDRLSTPTADFPDDSITGDKQFTIEKITTPLETRSPDGSLITVEAYRVSVAVRSPGAYIRNSGVVSISNP